MGGGRGDSLGPRGPGSGMAGQSGQARWSRSTLSATASFFSVAIPPFRIRQTSDEVLTTATNWRSAYQYYQRSERQHRLSTNASPDPVALEEPSQAMDTRDCWSVS